jgi:hypothetical protein
MNRKKIYFQGGANKNNKAILALGGVSVSLQGINGSYPFF